MMELKTSMKGIVLVDPANDSGWDKFVENHPLGWICHLSGWAQVLEKSFKHINGHYLALLDEGQNTIKSAMPLFEVRSWLTGKRLVSIPFATLCDPLISSSKDFEMLFESALDLAKRLGISHIQIKAYGSPSLIKDDRLGSTCFYKHHYLPLDSEPEQLKKSFHRTCVRQRISRAIKSNLTLRIADSESDLRDFYRLHLITRKRLGLPPQPYVFFESLWNTFFQSGRLSLLLAKKNGEATAALILFKFKDRVSAEIAASDDKYRDISPNHYLFWEAIKLACEQGYKIFDFGRTSPNNHRLMDFKERWGTKVIDLPEYHYPKQVNKKFAEPESSMRYKLIKNICRNVPAFASQCIGHFCYRHLG
jgi:hypothetical protein